MFVINELAGFGAGGSTDTFLTAEDVLHAVALDQGTVGVGTILISASMVQSVALDGPVAFDPVHILTAADLLHAVALDNASVSGGVSLLAAITTAGFAANTQLCLDAGDSASYSGSGQVWADLSGNGYDFNRGADATSEATDPTFNGTAGALTDGEYWSFDGDKFRYDSASEPWMDALHKDSANFTVVAVFDLAASSGVSALFGTRGGSSGPGVSWRWGSTEIPTFTAYGDIGASAFSKTGSNALATGQWHFIALSISESGNSGFFYKNGAYDQVSGADTWPVTYSSPGVDTANHVMEIGGQGNNANLVASGSRLACFAVLDTALSKSQIDSIYDAIKGRFGLA